MSGTAACPACVALPDQALEAAGSAGLAQVILSVPGVHCVACIKGIERALMARGDVMRARVNLSQRRVTVGTDGTVAPEALIDTLALAGYAARPMDRDLIGASADPVGRALMTRIAVAGFAMMNVTLLSVAVWSGAVGATRELFHLISAAIAIPALAYAAQPFMEQAWRALRVRRLNMDVPISVAIVLATGMSLFEATAGGGHAYFDAALSLTFFLLIGRYLDHRTRQAAVSAAAQLAALEVPRVMRLRDGVREMVDFSALSVGDLIAVPPGGRIPVDGVVTEGSSRIDRSLLTGESRLADAGPGAAVTAGEVNMTGPLTLRATTVGEATTLRKMVTMVDQAEAVRNRYTAIADRAATIYAPAVHLLALVAFAGWMLASGDLRLSLNIAVAVLIITCPCALGLAVPAVSTVAAGRLFRAGLLVKDGTALERLAEVDTVVFDKTGTLTLPMAAQSASAMNGQAAAIALAMTRAATHPVSQAVAAELEARGVQAADVTDQREHPGQGLSARADGQLVRLGSGAWLGMTDGTYLQIGDGTPQKIEIAAQLRDGAAELIAAWRAAGLTVHLISGDGQDETARVARQLGIEHWQAATSPADKIARLNAMRADGAKVLMVGDGLNDTGALAAAHASVAPATAADASRAAADIVLLNDSLRPLIDLPLVARAARARVVENFALALAYNAVAIPVALAGFATPLLAAIAMSTSSLSVLLNALRLRGRT